MAYLLFALCYALLLPLWGLASNLLSAPSSVKFSLGILLVVGMLAYTIFVTKLVVEHVKYDIQ